MLLEAKKSPKHLFGFSIKILDPDYKLGFKHNDFLQ